MNVLSFSTYNFHLLRSWMQLVQFFIFSFFMSFIMSSSHLFFGLPSGRVNIGFHLYTLFTILSSCIRCKWPNQLNLCAFMWFIMFVCLINSSNSSIVSILHVPSVSFAEDSQLPSRNWTVGVASSANHYQTKFGDCDGWLTPSRKRLQTAVRVYRVNDNHDVGWQWRQSSTQ